MLNEPSPHPPIPLSPHLPIGLLAVYLRPQLPEVSLLALLLLGNVGLQLVNPLLLRRFIDAAKAGGALEALATTALLFLAIALVAQVTAVWEAYTAEDLSWTATNRLRTDLAAHLLRLDMGFHTAHLPGEMVQRIDYDVGLLANFFSRFLLSVLASALLLVGTLAVLFHIDGRIGLAFAIFAAIGLAVLLRIRVLATPAAKNSMQTVASLYGYIGDCFAATEDLRARGADGYVLQGLIRRLRDRLHASRRYSALYNLTLTGPMRLLAVLGTALAFAVGGSLFRHGTISIGTVYLLVSYAALISQPLLQLTTQLQDFQQATAAIGRVQELLGLQSDVADGPGPPFPDGALAVDMAGVSFAYGDGPLVLQDISFTVAPGTVLGVLGRTGSGKTTLTRLLLRLYAPSGGVIRLGGIDLRAAAQRDICRRVALVTQEVQVFQGTVRDNLTFFDPAIPDTRILAALGELGLWSWYAGLPRGLETELAAGGSGLSAGEAQLLAFTRVFLRDPALVILDEASSRLDPATELALERAIDRLHGRTAIIVAHRLATVRRADEVLILADGRIVEHGRREQLAADPSSRFAGLLRTGLEVAFA